MYKIIVYTLIIIAYIFAQALCGYCADASDNGFIYDNKSKRDPFIPLVGQERSVGAGLETIVSQDDVKLEGIAIGAGGKQIAILNGHMVKENNKFGALVIKKISRKSVEISIEGRDYTLTLQGSEKDNAGK